MTNYYEILGVSRRAEAPEISQAYRRQLQQSYQEMGREADLSLLSQAHKTLTSPAKRREYDGKLDMLSGQFTVKDPVEPTKAEQAYLDGVKAFDNQNYQEAVQYFARAARLDPHQGHFFSQWGLSIGMFPGRLPEAELYCKKAIELDPDNPVFYFNLGFLYQRHNLSEAAQQSFVKAQEAQQVRQAKHTAGESAAISVSWRGDAGSLLKELDSIEETMAQPGVIALPQGGAPVPEEQAGRQGLPASEAAPEQTPALAEEYSSLSGVDDLLSELDSLESSMGKVEDYHNGRNQAPPETEAVPLEIVTIRDELKAQMPSGEQDSSPEGQVTELEIVTVRDDLNVRQPSGEPEPLPENQDAGSELKIVTIQEDLVPGEQKAPALGSHAETETQDEPHLDLLKELDSIESMVAGLEQSVPDQSPPRQTVTIQEAENQASEPNARDLESEALKLLQELDVPLDDHTTEPAVQEEEANEPALPVEPNDGEIISEPDAETIKKKMEKLNQMEEQMMEDLLKLKAERERLKADLKV